jgi:hypothetical protein
LGFASRLLVVLLAERDELLGEGLRFFGFGPRRRERLAREEGVDEVAEELPPLLGVAAEFAVGGHGGGFVERARETRSVNGISLHEMGTICLC